MSQDVFHGRDFENELNFSASRSSGPGGQNVNKVSTRVELRFSVVDSQILNDYEKRIIQEKLATRINNEGYLIITSQSERSQFDNRQKTIEKFYSMLRKALTPVKKRIPTKPNAAARQKRLESKKVISRKKELRKAIDDL